MQNSPGPGGKAKAGENQNDEDFNIGDLLQAWERQANTSGSGVPSEREIITEKTEYPKDGTTVTKKILVTVEKKPKPQKPMKFYSEPQPQSQPQPKGPVRKTEAPTAKPSPKHTKPSIKFFRSSFGSSISHDDSKACIPNPHIHVCQDKSCSNELNLMLSGNKCSNKSFGSSSGFSTSSGYSSSSRSGHGSIIKKAKANKPQNYLLYGGSKA